MNPDATEIPNRFIAVDPKNSPYDVNTLCNILYENTDQTMNQKITKPNEDSKTEMCDDLLFVLREAVEKLKTHITLSELIESPRITLDMLLLNTNRYRNKEKLIHLCIEYGLLNLQKNFRDIDTINLLIEIIKNGRHLGLNILKKYSLVKKLNNEELLVKLTDSEQEKQIIDNISEWSPGVAMIFSKFIISCIKKEIIITIKKNNINN
jgi:hypothetical protein